jgi:hypothetical protein
MRHFARRGATGAVLATLALLAPAGPAGAAAPGVPDRGFGTGGISRQAFPGDAAQAVAVLPAGGGLAVVGETATTTSRQGRIIVSGFSAGGVLDPSFGSTFGWDNAAPVVGGTLRAAGNRLVIAQNGTPGGAFPERIRLTGTGAAGKVDPVFGTGGHVTLSTPGRAVRLLAATDGTLLVAGERAATSSGAVTGALLTRVTPDGVELGSGTIPLGPEASVGAAVRLADDSVLVVGSDPHLFLARFTPAGNPDPTFGTGGVRHLGGGDVLVDDARLDGEGRLLVAGAHLGNLGRSVGAPVRPLLARMSASGAPDGSFAAVGRGPGDVDELTSVRTAGGRIYASAPDGRVLRFSGAGRPDLRFGAGGTSVPTATQFFDGTGLALLGGGALVAGATPAPTGFDNRLAVTRVKLTGSTLLRPARRARVQLHRAGGKVTVRVPVSPADQPVGRGVTVPLLVRSINGGDGFHFAPPGAVAGALRGSVTVTGVGGAAVVRHARFTLRRAAKRIAELDLARPKCGAVRRTSMRLRGPWLIRDGKVIIRNSTHRAVVLVSRRCGTATKVRALRGKVTVTR